MKEQKKNEEKAVEKVSHMEFTIDDSLNKYKTPEYQSPKLKEVEKRFSKGYIIHR